jgi:hypothetical protein
VSFSFVVDKGEESRICRSSCGSHDGFLRLLEGSPGGAAGSRAGPY